jgi:hypothetical protein
MLFQPLHGWRQGKVTARRTAKDFAPCRQERGHVHFPKATVMRVVLDTLNTQTPAAWSEACSPPEARRPLRTLDVRSTPQQGSWRNMAALEFAVVSTQGVDRRRPDQETG